MFDQIWNERQPYQKHKKLEKKLQWLQRHISKIEVVPLTLLHKSNGTVSLQRQKWIVKVFWWKLCQMVDDACPFGQFVRTISSKAEMLLQIHYFLFSEMRALQITDDDDALRAKTHAYRTHGQENCTINPEHINCFPKITALFSHVKI